jgi:hypothetical protein
MLNCERASELLSRALDERLPVTTRMRLRFHVTLCRCCSALEKNFGMLRGTVRQSRADNNENGDLKKLEDTVRRELQDSKDEDSREQD